MTTNTLVNKSCPVCGSKERKNSYEAREMYYGTRQKFEYLECRSCDAVYISELPDNIASFYPENYHCHVSKSCYFPENLSQKIVISRDQSAITGRGVIGKLFAMLKPAPQLLEILSHLRLTLDSKVIDVGCGSADLLKRLEKLGFTNLTGVDPYLPERLMANGSKLNLIKNDIYGLGEKFDAVIFNHSLEHMQDHAGILKKTKTLLKDNGKCCVRIPLVGEAWRRYASDWVQLDAPRHFTLHSPKSFRLLAESCGFKIEKVIYDSSAKQFAKSEIYRRDISSSEFAEKYEGKLTNLFSEEKIMQYKKLAAKCNEMGTGDQASFILSPA